MVLKILKEEQLLLRHTFERARNPRNLFDNTKIVTDKLLGPALHVM